MKPIQLCVLSLTMQFLMSQESLSYSPLSILWTFNPVFLSFIFLQKQNWVRTVSLLPAFNLMVYSGKVLGHSLKHLDILNLFNTFSIPSWMYWITSLTLVSIILLLINAFFTFFASESVEDNESETMWNWIKEFTNFWWDFFMLAIDMAPSLVSSHLSSAVLWTSLVIACYMEFTWYSWVLCQQI